MPQAPRKRKQRLVAALAGRGVSGVELKRVAQRELHQALFCTRHLLGALVQHDNSRAHDARTALVLNHPAERTGRAALPERC